MTTILVARHGQADYEHPGVLHDEGGWLTPLGRQQVAALAERVAGRDVAAVYTSRLQRAIESGEIAARALGRTTTAVDGLHEFPAGDLAGRAEGDPELSVLFRAFLRESPEVLLPGGAETGVQILARYRAALTGIAQRHAGETVLVVSHGGVMSYALPRLAGNVADDVAGTGYLPNCAVVEATVEGDAFRIGDWPETHDWPAPSVEPPPG